jgi:hypothetical protein
MIRRTQSILFAAVAILGALLIVVGFLQHFALQAKLLHLAAYLVAIGSIMCLSSIISLFVIAASAE